MSEDQSPSVVTRLVPGVTILALIIMIASAIFHVVSLSPEEAPPFDRASAPTAPDYAQASSWIVYPETETAGGWERPWGVDLLIYRDQPDGFLGGWNVPLDWSGNVQISDDETSIISAVDPQHAVYLPKRRHRSSLNGAAEDQQLAEELETEDALDSADYYLQIENRQRGIFLTGAGTGVDMSLEVYNNRITETLPYADLIGGLIVLPGRGFDEAILPDWSSCSETLGIYPCLLDLRGLNGADIGSEVSATLSDFSSWLDDTAPKPAAPLPPMEMIEIAPINRPDGQ